jgi:hypothetical protein
VNALKSGTGSSGADDARLAGREAAEAALRSLAGPDPLLVLIYASIRYDLPELLAGVRSVTGDTPLAGSTSSGHFSGKDVSGPGEGITVLILGGGNYRFAVASAIGMGVDAEGVGKALARAAKAAVHRDDAVDLPYAAMILLTDGLGGDQQGVLTGVHRVCGSAVPVVGGAAGDDRQLMRTSVFHDDAVLTDAAVGVWISSPRPLTVTSAHGWKAVSPPLLITRSEGQLIHELGGRPAGEVYLELAAQAPEQNVLPNGTIWQSSHALGLIEPDGSHLIRGVFATPEGPISTFTPLPAYSAVQLMKADPDMLLAVIEDVIDRTLAFGDETVLLVFDCVARMDIMGAAFRDEISAINRAARGTQVFGLYTYGEFARVKGLSGVHNATLTTMAL